MRAAALALAVAGVLAGCGPGAGPDAEATGPGRSPTVAAARDTCVAGDVEAGLAGIEAAGARGADAHVAQAFCHWIRFDETGDDADGEAAQAALTKALAEARADGAGPAALARIYSHRAALRRARGGPWPVTLADLDAAVEGDTLQPLYVLDRAVARARQGDSAAAVRDFDRYLALDTLDAARADFARRFRDEVQPRRAAP